VVEFEAAGGGIISTYVPKSTCHRLENPGKVPLEMIEVQNGEYVGEDDTLTLIG